MYFAIAIMMAATFAIVASSSSSSPSSYSSLSDMWSSDGVYTELHSGWMLTSIAAETAEFMASESTSLFWSFIDIYERSDPSMTESMEYANVMSVAKTILNSDVSLSLLEISLSTHVASPAVEMQRSLGRLIIDHMDDNHPCRYSEAFVHVGGQFVACKPALIASVMAEAASKSTISPSTYKFDRVIGMGSHTVILYGSIGSAALHDLRAELSTTCYALRHYDIERQRINPSWSLSGYGVELAIKSMEYKAMDDTVVDIEHVNSGKRETRITEHTTHWSGERAWSSSEDTHSEETNEDEVSIGLRSSVRILQETNPIEALQQLSGDLPVYLEDLRRNTVCQDSVDAVIFTQRHVLSALSMVAGQSLFLVNGLSQDVHNPDIFGLLSDLRKEHQIVMRLQRAGVTSVSKVLDAPVHGDEISSDLYVRSRVPITMLDIRSPLVHFMNDLEADSRYKKFPKQVQSILRPMYPGQMHFIRKNMFTVVFAFNPTTQEGRDAFLLAHRLVKEGIPMRVGIILITSDVREEKKTYSFDVKKGAKVAVSSTDNNVSNSIVELPLDVAVVRVYAHIRMNSDADTAFSFLKKLMQHYDDDENPLTYTVLKSVASEWLAGSEINSALCDQYRSDADAFSRDKGLVALAESGVAVLLNGRVVVAGQNPLYQTLLYMYSEQGMDMQQRVYEGMVTDSTDIYDYFLSLPAVLPRYNPRLTTVSLRHLTFGDDAESDAAAARRHYVGMAKIGALYTVTHWVVADINEPRGALLVFEALRRAYRSKRVRVALLHNPSSEINCNVDSIAVALTVAAVGISIGSDANTNMAVLDFIGKAVASVLNFSTSNQDQPFTLDTLKDLVDATGFDILKRAAEACDIIKADAAFVKNTLGFAPGDRGVVMNGKVIGPLKAGEDLKLADFKFLERVEGKRRANPVADVLESSTDSDLLMKVTNILGGHSDDRTRVTVPSKLRSSDMTFYSDAHDATSELDVVAVVDPLSKEAQLISAILVMLRASQLPVRLSLFFNPSPEPVALNRFYRYVLEPHPKFEESGERIQIMALFQRLPVQPLLTMSLEVPSAWLVESVKSTHDLDNIHVDTVGSAHAVYRLRHLLLEGSAQDSETLEPPRGLQLTLANRYGTIVMANLGYFQFKVGPGVWPLAIRKGRSADIYELIDMDDADAIVLDDFRGKFLSVRARKREGMEGAMLLDDDAVVKDDETEGAQSGSGLFSFFGTDNDSDGANTMDDSNQVLEEKEEKIHIFSIASGHLYERFLRIMMLSVLRHTTTPVKFWFLGTYLSPDFRLETLDRMASEYNFEYELVSYKWPSWLRLPPQKMRVIWGFKILFLDVLFPLDVDRIIFVDADQVVRADLVELMRLDLKGAPYAYTPFCKDRAETAGFRFWESGYWATHLRGSPYHISALYVVDLKRFRLMAAGDRLRGQYHGLSADPNSLSNLDQDLPNNMIHQLPIYSLPQEWLWCETWCSDEIKPKAKTIDLCNNPLTKEPKLEGAVRIVPEWTAYDDEIKEFLRLSSSVDNSKVSLRDEL